MTRFPTYPPDILSRADALLSEKYPDGIVDPLLVEIACEAMMAQREADAKIADFGVKFTPEPAKGAQWFVTETAYQLAKAIRGTE